MENAHAFRDKIRRGQVCLGAGITFTDPTATEALCGVVDYVWIDMEHNALSLEAVQGHIMATKGSDTASLVRVRWNDPVLIKPVLDIGADGVIVPLVRTVEDVERAVAACRYPPEGIRGYGPRRPSNYGRTGGAEFCRAANEAVIVTVQIEHIDAVRNLDGILAVPGLTGIMIGPNDLSGSMGYMGQTRHPEVMEAIETVITRAKQAGVYVGIAASDRVSEWADRGAQWLLIGEDYSLMLQAADEVAGRVRDHLKDGD